MKKRGWLLVNSAIVFACLVAIWSGVVEFAHLPGYLMPGPKAVALAIRDRYPSLLNSLSITAIEALSGLAASIVVGIAIALIFARARWLRQLVYPYTILLQTVPIIAIAPQGLVSVDENLFHLFVMQRASPTQILFKLRLPHALPNLFTGIRISAGISVIGGLTGELFAGSTRVGEGGLGYAIIYANNQMETSYLFALVFAATVLGFCFFFIVMFVEWLFLHNWHESSRQQAAD